MKDRLARQIEKSAILFFIKPPHLVDGYYPDDIVRNKHILEHKCRCIKTSRQCIAINCTSTVTRKFFQTFNRYMCNPCHLGYTIINKERSKRVNRARIRAKKRNDSLSTAPKQKKIKTNVPSNPPKLAWQAGLVAAAAGIHKVIKLPQLPKKHHQEK